SITQVVNAAEQVNSGAGQIASASQALASGTTEQAASLEETSSSMSEVGSRAKINNENANQAVQLSNQTLEIVNRGNAQMEAMLASMDKINNSSGDISKIIKVIDEIAFQTNLLALNAAVEAARAGKYGKGFAVVAEEVRNLAARSAEAAKNTTGLIENSVKEVDSGVLNAGKTAEILNEINVSITKVNDLVGEIASSSQEQRISTDEVNKALTQVNDVVQQNSSISEQTAAASEELSGQAMQLQELMRRFKVNQTKPIQERAQVQRAAVQKKGPAEKPVKSPKMITLDDDRFGKV
ncbi:methyl-accepting chemotaxis protein, partial [bacterium]|nr:methyl-accepting chemotaxis protein [bacterium]